MQLNIQNVGERLKICRNAHGYTMDEVVTNLGIHKTTLSKYEKGQRKVNHEILAKLALFYQVPLDFIAYGILNQAPNELRFNFNSDEDNILILTPSIKDPEIAKRITADYNRFLLNKEMDKIVDSSSIDLILKVGIRKLIESYETVQELNEITEHSDEQDILDWIRDKL